jgi:glycine dehydrogenase subunit 1
MVNYLPHAEGERAEMLAAIGVDSVADLFTDIPAALRLAELNLPEGLSELELQDHLRQLSLRNTSLKSMRSFLGAGIYHRYVPAVVDTIISRGEFLTAYTPYQPEIAQGTLQVIYEFQTMICELTGMDVANASLYDGPTAVAEGAFLACRSTKRNAIVIPSTVHPETRQVLRTYASGPEMAVVEVASREGAVDLDALAAVLTTDVACVVIQQPNFFGTLEDVAKITEMAHAVGALVVAYVEPVSLGLLQSPGEWGADIVAGDAQPFGIAPQFGGPTVGFIGCRDKYLRQLPGRVAGATTDAEGKVAYTLTLQTREQHIRREKATSNICTNQALCALAVTVYLTCLGPQGVQEVAEVSVRRAHALADKLAKVPGFSIAFQSPYFHEFVLRCDVPVAEVLAGLRQRGILGGVALGTWYPDLADCILVAVTETNSPADLDAYAAALAEVAGGAVAWKN